MLRLPRFTRRLTVALALAAAAVTLSAGVLTPPARAAAPSSAGPLLWTTPAPVDVTPIDAIACPSAQLCVAVDRAGNALWSTNPAGGLRAWHAARIDPGHELTGIACPSTGLCVAIDGAGNAVTSLDPTGGPSAWAVANIDSSSTQSNSDTAGPVLLRGISCPSTGLCVAVDSDGNAVVSTDPTGGSTAWTITQADTSRSNGCSGAGLTCQPPLIGVSCPSAGLCAAVDFSGNVLTTQTPTAPGPWLSTPAEGGRLGSLWGISCPLQSFCATVDGDANRVITFNPSVPAVQHARAVPDAVYGVWCASQALCLASAQTPAGLSGLLGSYDPAARRSTWSLSSPGAITGVACPSAAVCVAGDGEGNVAAGVTTRAAGALLRTALLPTRRLPTIAALDRTHHERFVLTSPIAARVTLTWTLPGSQVTIASVTYRFARPGTARLTLPLTPYGVALFRAATSRVQVAATATFATATGALRVTGTRTFTHPPVPHTHRRRHKRKRRR